MSGKLPAWSAVLGRICALGEYVKGRFLVGTVARLGKGGAWAAVYVRQRTDHGGPLRYVDSL